MPVVYTKLGGQGHAFQVPDYPEASDGPKAFKDFADYLDLILPPVGTIMPYVGNSAPTGWLLCDGASYSSTSYPKLSALCGTKFGIASAGLFRVPDLKGRSVVGLDSGQSEFETIGKTGGAKSVTLTVSNLPAHDHTMPEHEHGASGTLSIGTPTGNSHTHPFSGTASGTTGNANTGHAHDTRINSASNFRRDGSNSGAVVSSSSTGNDTTSSGATHTHTFSATVSGSTTGPTGDTHTHEGTVSITVTPAPEATSGTAGSGAAVNTMDPFLTLNHIIRAA